MCICHSSGSTGPPGSFKGETLNMMPTQNHWMRWRSMMLLTIRVGMCDTSKLGIDLIPSKYRVGIADIDTSHLLKPLMYLHEWELTPTCVIFDDTWTSWQLPNWKYRPLHTLIDLTSAVPLSISLLAAFGSIRPPPYLRARWIWQRRRWAWGRRWRCQSDTPQWTWGCLRWPAEGCTGTLQRCTATALLWREGFFFVMD